jgi:energy-coupling factor transport system ATP-binding protein
VKVSIEHVSFSYPGGIEALHDVSLTIEPGEAVAILGENGAGKSTLAKHLNGLLRPGTGRVLIDDWDTREHTTAQMAQRVGYVFQNPDDQLFERVVRREVAFGPRNLGHTDAEVDRLVAEALEQVGLADHADAHPYDLPLSERKLLTLGAVLAMQTPIIIFDEPTTGQDARGVERIGRIIEDLKAEGRTVITISHDVDFCAEHFPRAVLMSRAQVMLDGPVETVLSDGQHLAQAAVEPPQMVRLAEELDMAARPLTVEQFVDALVEERAG